MSTLRRITCTLPPGTASPAPDLVCAHLALHAPHGWEEQTPEGGGTRYIIHSGRPNFCSDLARGLAGLFPTLVFQEETVKEENWQEAWKEFFTPVEAGRFLVLPPWMRELDTAGRIPIVIEPKTAFGTGHHASTALCLEALSRLFVDGRISAGMRFLDLGTGTGILGIAAALLGLNGQGLDIDPVAVDNAIENGKGNGLSSARFLVEMGGLDAARGPCRLILANILAGPLIDLAPGLSALLSPQGGALILSGILETQAEAVARAYTACGLPRPFRLAREEWTALIFT
ncbi:MAG: 50S ribosomal protein L11 methyltransferase [Desulfovibrio sp.]|jgi:ribosomal protein L11 methyltransferase|nr:50S ribosomal protein L11 methyltransferase [Desulfovibrio sp.]